MTRYAVGDIQGCLDPLLCLLDEVNFDPACDQLWCAGDLINRGPRSLDTLRFIHSLGSSAKVVLGNHDLHFLAVRYSIKPQKKKDTVAAILASPDCDALCEWLAAQKLFYRDPDDGWCMVHAGLAPQWTTERAEQLSREVEKVLRGPKRQRFLTDMYGDNPACWSEHLTGTERLRVITNYFTRVRLCDENGYLELETKEGPEFAPAGFMPWYAVPGRASADTRIIFGHWAAHGEAGELPGHNVFALDTGCVWGREMTMMNLETRQLYRCDCGSP